MTCGGETSKIKVEFDNFLFYRKSKVGVIVAKLTEPLLSNGATIAYAGEISKIKFKYDIVDFTKLSTVKFLEIIIRNSYEEKMVNGRLVKQFTAERMTDYISDKSKSVCF